MVSSSELAKVKERLFSQLDKFPEEQRNLIRGKIEEMSDDELLKFIEENNIATHGGSKCIFCSIVNKEIDSFAIDENENYLAVLNINPLSKGHVSVIPKKHKSLKETDNSFHEFAKNISLEIANNLNPQNISIKENEIFGHAVLDIVPIYEGQKLEKRVASEEELMSLMNLLKKKEEKKEENTKTKKEEDQTKKEEKDFPKIKHRTLWI